jgi:hypothetical protein
LRVDFSNFVSPLQHEKMAGAEKGEKNIFDELTGARIVWGLDIQETCDLHERGYLYFPFAHSATFGARGQIFKTHSRFVFSPALPQGSFASLYLSLLGHEHYSHVI